MAVSSQWRWCSQQSRLCTELGMHKVALQEGLWEQTMTSLDDADEVAAHLAHLDSGLGDGIAGQQH